MDNLLSYTSIGLAYDAIGVVILGYAFFSNAVSEIYLRSQTFWGDNSGEFEALIESKTDGIIGTALLVIGFILQWCGNNNYHDESLSKFLLIILAVFLFCYFLFLRKIIKNYFIKKAKKFEEKWKKETS